MQIFRKICSLFLRSSWPEPRILDDFHQIDTETRDALELLEDVELGGQGQDDGIDPYKEQAEIARIIQNLSKGILRYLKASESAPAGNFDHQNATAQFPQDLFRTSWSFPHFQKLMHSSVFCFWTCGCMMAQATSLCIDSHIFHPLFPEIHCPFL